MLKSVFIIYLSMLKIFIYFCFFYRAFLLVFFTSKNISRIAKISYNRNPVNSTDIYISSNKFVMNGAISMEIRFNTFPLSS
jgi:hypothetical protein